MKCIVKPTHKWLLPLALICAMAACKETEEFVPDDPETKARSTFNNDLNPFKDMPKLAQSPVGVKVKETNTASDGCIVETHEVTAGYDEHLLLDASSNIIHLGAVLDAESIPTGAYKVITGINKRPIDISIWMPGLVEFGKKDVNPTLLDTRQAIGDLVNQNTTGERAGQFSFTFQQIRSENHLKTAVGTSFGLGKLKDVTSSFDFDKQDNKTRAVAKFLQTDYTADMGVPDDGVYVEDYPDEEKFGEYSPVYVSSLTFGRIGLFFMESTHSAQEMELAVRASFNFLVKGEGSVSTQQKKILDETIIKVYINGGNSSEQVASVEGYEGFVQYIKDGGKFSASNPGALLSYKLSHLKDHTTFKVNLTSTYPVRDCSNQIVSIYRFWNNHGLGQLLTQNKNEVVNKPGWISEGVGFTAYKTQVEGTIPIYRFWSHEHGQLLTQNKNEVVNKPGWISEGIGFYAFPK